MALVNNCDGSSFENCLWAGNECVWRGYYTDGGESTSGSGALCLSLGASNQVVTVKNCTIAYNMADIGSTSAGITITKGTLELVDSIVYGNFGALFMRESTGRDLALTSSNAYARVRYSLIGTPGVAAVSSSVPENVSTNASDGVILGDPLLVTEYASVTNMVIDQGDDRNSHLHHLRFSNDALAEIMDFNLHLRGGSGYVDETTGEVVKDWTRRRYGNSPAIDAGDPAVRCVEPHPNGYRVNMGFYGNTEWATMSRDGLLIFVK